MHYALLFVIIVIVNIIPEFSSCASLFKCGRSRVVINQDKNARLED
jgi:hypothetical protein